MSGAIDRSNQQDDTAVITYDQKDGGSGDGTCRTSDRLVVVGNA